MATRRDAREWALQVLFGLDLNPAVTPDQAIADFMTDKHGGKALQAFMGGIVNGVVAHRESIDAIIRECADHWDVGRMGVVERNVIRMGAYELLYMPETPAAVVINEAVDISKYFSRRESGRFVNGILDRIRKRGAHDPAVSG
jgi:transcription antitermination protein NusB